METQKILYNDNYLYWLGYKKKYDDENKYLWNLPPGQNNIYPMYIETLSPTDSASSCPSWTKWATVFIITAAILLWIVLMLFYYQHTKKLEMNSLKSQIEDLKADLKTSNVDYSAIEQKYKRPLTICENKLVEYHKNDIEYSKQMEQCHKQSKFCDEKLARCDKTREDLAKNFIRIKTRSDDYAEQYHDAHGKLVDCELKLLGKQKGGQWNPLSCSFFIIIILFVIAIFVYNSSTKTVITNDDIRKYNQNVIDTRQIASI